MSNSSLIKCSDCGKSISASAKSCPNCGKPGMGANSNIDVKSLVLSLLGAPPLSFALMALVAIGTNDIFWGPQPLSIRILSEAIIPAVIPFVFCLVGLSQAKRLKNVKNTKIALIAGYAGVIFNSLFVVVITLYHLIRLVSG